MSVKNKLRKYVVSKTHDDLGNPVWYCHMEGYHYIPVLGSIGDAKTAKRVCRERNKSIGR